MNSVSCEAVELNVCNWVGERTHTVPAMVVSAGLSQMSAVPLTIARARWQVHKSSKRQLRSHHTRQRSTKAAEQVRLIVRN